MTLKLLATFLLCLTLSACASVVRNPVPEADHLNVTVLGNEHIRQWGDGVGIRSLPLFKNVDDLEARYGGIMHREHNYLVISGGGSRGA